MYGTSGGARLAQVGIEAFTQGSPPWPMQLILLFAALLSASVWYRLTSPSGRWGRRLRSRLLLGVPWGTLTVGVFLLGMFLFVQGAYSGDVFDPRQPVTYAFVAWSYEYPLGVLTAAFSHSGFGHLFGNLVSLFVFGSIAEYGFSHFPSERGAQVHESLSTSPYGRPLAVVGAMLLIGLLTAVFTPGPIIGFSGVVYALAGFALIVRPLSAIGGLLMVDVVSNLYRTFTNPVSTWSPSVQYVDVWFANIAVLGHFLGFVIGVLLGIAVVRSRSDSPNIGRLWAGTILFGLLQGLWLAYVPLGNGRFRLFRAPGVAFIFLVAAVVVVAVDASSRPSIPWPSRFPERVRSEMPSRGTVASMGLVVVVLGLASVGVVTHLATVDSTQLPNEPVQVRDYQIGYSENVTNQMYSLVDIPLLQQEETIQSSGVIVYSDRRDVWQVATSTSALASRGSTTVTVGGVGWRETVGVTRTGWSVVGGGQAYRVRLHPPDASPRVAYTSDPATAEVVIANRSISIRPSGTTFELVVGRDNETLGVVAMPSAGSNATVGQLRFEREGKNLYVRYDGTRVRVANKVVPRTRRN